MKNHTQYIDKPWVIYVLLYCTGAVKVGRTRDFDTRIAYHKNTAGNHLQEVLAYHSVEVSMFGNFENILLEWMRANFTRTKKREIFLDCDYELVVEQLGTMQRVADDREWLVNICQMAGMF